jgi:hypothetical protein
VRLPFSVKSIFRLFLDLQPRFSLFTPCFRLSVRPSALPPRTYFHQYLCSLSPLTAPLVVSIQLFSPVETGFSPAFRFLSERQVTLRIETLFRGGTAPPFLRFCGTGNPGCARHPAEKTSARSGGHYRFSAASGSRIDVCFGWLGRCNARSKLPAATRTKERSNAYMLPSGVCFAVFPETLEKV